MGKLLFIFIGCIVLVSCDLRPQTCEEWANDYRVTSECNLVLHKIEHNGPLMYLYGEDLDTETDIEFYEGSGWISKIYHQFKPGDTIVKVKGSYLTTIKRKNKIITIPFKCPETGKILTDSK